MTDSTRERKDSWVFIEAEDVGEMRDSPLLMEAKKEYEEIQSKKSLWRKFVEWGVDKKNDFVEGWKKGPVWRNVMYIASMAFSVAALACPIAAPLIGGAAVGVVLTVGVACKVASGVGSAIVAAKDFVKVARSTKWKNLKTRKKAVEIAKLGLGLVASATSIAVPFVGLPNIISTAAILGNAVSLTSNVAGVGKFVPSLVDTVVDKVTKDGDGAFDGRDCTKTSVFVSSVTELDHLSDVDNEIEELLRNSSPASRSATEAVAEAPKKKKRSFFSFGKKN
jgi:hypothetical protein